VNIFDLSTPALLIDADALEHNLATMAAALPGSRLRPHVKAHKCTSLAAAQRTHGHRSFTCATPREIIGMANAGLGDDLLLANETLDPARLGAMAALQDHAVVTVAVDSSETIDAAASAGLKYVLIDVNVGLPRCGCKPSDAGHLADDARRRGLVVRGVMGYEGHLMAMSDRSEQRVKVRQAMEKLTVASLLVGADIISAGGTDTYDLHDQVTEVQAGTYALMDTYYGGRGHPFRQACFVLATVIASNEGYAVADAGLKTQGMDHGNPSIEGATVHFLSDEHITFTRQIRPTIGDRVKVIPAHIDPTMAMHEVAWLVRGDDVIDRWPIDLRGW
jgi:D-serine deaminase-like pyridoxal phosphate-dependent protein